MAEGRDRLGRLEKEVAALREEFERLKASAAGRLPGVEEALAARGLAFARDATRPEPLVPEGEERAQRFYALMKRYSFRIFMRDLINGRSCRAGGRWKYITPATARRYLGEVVALGLARDDGRGEVRLLRGEVSSFGETLEWFVAEALKREFRLPAARSLLLPGLTAGGDFDLLASTSAGLLYLEVKSSPPKHIEGPEVAAFAARFKELAPRAAVFLVDTQLRLRDKVVPLLEQALGPGTEAEHLKKGVYLFPGSVWAASSKPSLLHNLRFCLEEMYRRETIW